MQQQDIFQHIFNYPASKLDIKPMLQKTIEKYPYFGLAHFYLLKNTAFHETDFNTIAVKTNLFFNNTSYLLSLLQPAEKLVEPINEKKTDQEPPIKLVPQDNLQPATVSNKIVLKKIEAITKTMIQEDNQILFEPLHASDYFASQGIKLSELQLADDKLGKQLKSFTSWLKTMKKVHPNKLPITNVVVEKAIQTLAEKSNVEEDIHTEAMAEAYLLQGKETKAIEIYKKLSLLIPAKSTYFATKIESLK